MKALRSPIAAMLAAALAAVGGCAVHKPTARIVIGPPATRAVDPSEDALAELLPAPRLEPAPSTRPAPPPIAALDLYARAHDAQLADQNQKALELLEKAIVLDPGSFELNFALGKACLATAAPPARALGYFERAAAIEPDHLELQVQLGRLYLESGDIHRATVRLRLALQTSRYREGGPSAALADLFLAEALQRGGYDLAALEMYARLLKRLDPSTLGGDAVRSDPEIQYLVTNQLQVSVGALYEKHGMYTQALAAYEAAGQRDPEDFPLQPHIVHLLMTLGRNSEAMQRAVTIVEQFDASSRSMALLRQTFHDAGMPAAAQLAQLQAAHPADRPLLFALTSLLSDAGDWSRGDMLLALAQWRWPGDFGILRQRVQLWEERDGPAGGASLLMQSLARQTGVDAIIGPLWMRMTLPTSPRHITLSQLQAIVVDSDAAAAKWYTVARVAHEMQRQDIAAAALAKALQSKPPFAPAYRQALRAIWDAPLTDSAAKASESQLLSDRARISGDLSLALEILGLRFFRQHNFAAAAAMLDQAAARSAEPSPALQLARARAWLGAGNRAKFTAITSAIVAQWSDDQAYEALYDDHLQHHEDDQAAQLVLSWLAENPGDVPARIHLALDLYRASLADRADRVMRRLFRERGDEARVVAAMQSYYQLSNRSDDLLPLLDNRLSHEPDNLAVLSALIDLHRDRRDGWSAQNALNAAAAKLDGDSQSLYQLATLAQRADQPTIAESLLRDSLRIDPANPMARGTLAYLLANSGADLADAETLARGAAAAEPGNPAILDSLGWVLYKRGQFAAARDAVQKSLGPPDSAAAANPVFLDHLGDIQYRLGDAKAAAAAWARAAKALEAAKPDGDDLRALRLRLMQKQQQVKAGQPPSVASVGEAKE